MSPAEMAERVRAELAKNPGLGAALVSAGAEAMGAAEIAQRAACHAGKDHKNEEQYCSWFHVSLLVTRHQSFISVLQY